MYLFGSFQNWSFINFLMNTQPDTLILSTAYDRVICIWINTNFKILSSKEFLSRRNEINPVGFKPILYNLKPHLIKSTLSESIGFIYLKNLSNWLSAHWANVCVLMYSPGTRYAQSQMTTWNQNTVWYVVHTYNTLFLTFCRRKQNYWLIIKKYNNY